MARTANLPAWAGRLHGSQQAAAEGEPLSLSELLLQSHAILLQELMRIQRHLGMDTESEPAPDE